MQSQFHLSHAHAGRPQAQPQQTGRPQLAALKFGQEEWVPTALEQGQQWLDKFGTAYHHVVDSVLAGTPDDVHTVAKSTLENANSVMDKQAEVIEMQGDQIAALQQIRDNLQNTVEAKNAELTPTFLQRVTNNIGEAIAVVTTPIAVALGFQNRNLRNYQEALTHEVQNLKAEQAASDVEA